MSVIIDLMVEEEFFGIDQCPDEILETLPRGLLWIDRRAVGRKARFRKVGDGGLQFLRARRTSEACQVQLADPLLNRPRVFRKAFGATVGAGELGFDVRGVDQVQALCKTRGLYAFALADA